MRVRQQDIARIANVSQATVSRVLSGDGRVEEIIRDRVVAAMRDNNYQPDARARSLRKRRSSLIGLVVKRPIGGLSDDPFFANMISHIMDFLVDMPYQLCVEMVTSEQNQEYVYDEMLRTRRVDGLILVESEAKDDRRLSLLTAEGFPFVLIGNPVIEGGEINKHLYSVDNDNVHAAKMATNHLLEQGFKNIGFLAGPRGLTVSEDRVAGYKAAIESVQEPRIWHSAFGLSKAKDAARRIFSSESRPDALVVLDDFMAMGVVMAAREEGLSIPRDLGLISFNDSSLCGMLEGGLSSVSLNISEMVRIATGRLIKLVEGKEITGTNRVIIECDLKARGSSVRTRNS